jgi:hypothetical protein
VNNACRVDVLQTALEVTKRILTTMPNCGRHDPSETYHDLVEKVLDELLLKGPGSKQAMQVGSEQLGDEVAIFSCQMWSDRCVI